jgi:hypothetical protein
MGAVEVTAFLSHLATERCVSASTQNQAKSAILFLYEHVLGIDLPWLAEVVSAKVSRRLPAVLTCREVRSVLQSLDGTMWLVASLLYGPASACWKPCARVRQPFLGLAVRLPCATLVGRSAHRRAAAPPSVAAVSAANKGGRCVLSPLDSL